MKKICLSLLFLLTMLCRSQSADSIPIRGITYGLSFSPDYGYRILKTTSNNQWMKEAYDTLEIPRFSYTTGLGVNFHFAEKLFVSSGLFFSDKGERTRSYPIPPANNYINHYYYLDIPAKINYYVAGKKIKLFLSAGFAANIFLNSLTNSEIGSYGESKRVTTGTNISRLAVTFTGGFGIDCPLTTRWYFRLEPNYKRFITPVADGPLRKYLYSAGLTMGFFGSF